MKQFDLLAAGKINQNQTPTDLSAVFKRVRALGLTTSLDTNYDPSEEWRGFDTRSEPLPTISRPLMMSLSNGSDG